MFDCTARTGLASAGIPYDEIENLKSEENIEALFGNYSDNDNKEENDLVGVENSHNEVNLESLLI
ncbi:Hypothetical protein CINCED_3A010748 [Cinara cedri]|uniref:Uncharacterized protein n=1 Tax=Cinara cedri TaxID=506608 RepID=A0A5E4NPX8_9HEMI|nr:Hypothetical protein CINCED_3A010748 [Cinara cedri]